jgi:hypothetical protein
MDTMRQLLRDGHAASLYGRPRMRLTPGPAQTSRDLVRYRSGTAILELRCFPRPTERSKLFVEVSSAIPQSITRRRSL